MTITVIYQSNRYSPDIPRTRYVRKAATGRLYQWCEQAHDTKLDVRQGTATGDELPRHIKAACDQTPPNGVYACEWPFDSKEFQEALARARRKPKHTRMYGDFYR